MFQLVKERQYYGILRKETSEQMVRCVAEAFIAPILWWIKDLQMCDGAILFTDNSPLMLRVSDVTLEPFLILFDAIGHD